MFFLLVFLVLCTAVTSGQNCPKEKRVGDTCYTRVAMAHTHQYGCMENCSYKKTNSSDTGLYCFKTGSLQVTECGNFTGAYQEEGFLKIGVTCGSGVRREFCFQCGITKDSCQGVGDHPDCILTSSFNCIPNNRMCVPPFRPGPGPNGQDSLCYYFSNTLVNTWEDAENGCQRMNSYLAPVETQAQQEFIVKVIGSTTSDYTFIGGKSINNEDVKFYWVLTSTAVDDGFTFWGPGEPNYKFEQCMEMVKLRYPQLWMWNNVRCDRPLSGGLRSYVCAYDPKRGSSIRGSSILG